MVPYLFSVAQICNLSVSVEIVARRDEFNRPPPRSLPQEDEEENEEEDDLWLRLRRATLYRRFVICNRQGVETIRSLSNCSQPAECNSATQQIENLIENPRYEAKHVPGLRANLLWAFIRRKCHKNADKNARYEP